MTSIPTESADAMRCSVSCILNQIEDQFRTLPLSLDDKVKQNILNMSPEFVRISRMMKNKNEFGSKISIEFPMKHLRNILKACGLEEPMKGSFILLLFSVLRGGEQGNLEEEGHSCTGEEESLVDSEEDGSMNVDICWNYEDTPSISRRDSMEPSPSLSLSPSSSPLPPLPPESEHSLEPLVEEENPFLKDENEFIFDEIQSLAALEEELDSEYDAQRLPRNQPRNREDSLCEPQKFERIHQGDIVQVFCEPLETFITARVTQVFEETDQFELVEAKTHVEMGLFDRHLCTKKEIDECHDVCEDDRKFMNFFEMIELLSRFKVSFDVRSWSVKTLSFVLRTVCLKPNLSQVFTRHEIRGYHVLDDRFNEIVLRDLLGSNDDFLILDTMDFIRVLRRIYRLSNI